MPKIKQFYYFTPTKYALKAVKNCELKTTELNKANDPFEFLVIRCNNESEDKFFKEYKHKISDAMKMICLSKTSKEPSLWGHYADGCKGICLGFDVEVHEDCNERRIRQIQYVKDKKDMSEFGFHYVDGELKDIEDKGHNILFVKSHSWKHEEEWRIWQFAESLRLDATTGLFFLPFKPRLKLREILIGFRREEENIERRFERLIDDSKYPDPPEIFRTRLSPSAFEIEKAT